MPRDLEGLADVVVLTVKNAMAPALERIAILEKENTDLRQRLDVVTELRDRVVVVETKAAMPVPERDPQEPIDLTPIRTEIAGLEYRLAPVERTVHELRDLLIKHNDDFVSPQDMELAVRKSLDPLISDVGSVRERMAALEARAPIPGPPGKDGIDGKDGAPGKDGAAGRDGADGLGFDDLAIQQQDDRSFTVKAVRGDRIKDIGTVRFPVQIQRGVYVDGKAYESGDVVTWAGSQWHANEATSAKPGEGSKAWTLIVKRGRDGKDGRDALDPMPVVSVKR